MYLKLIVTVCLNLIFIKLVKHNKIFSINELTINIVHKFEYQKIVLTQLTYLNKIKSIQYIFLIQIFVNLY